ncbi:NAD(P)-binding domain-containing protein, partial [Janibacter sp. RAF20_2_2]
MSMDVAIIGQGYVGLPLAQEASRVGVKVLGFDINQGVVDALNSGVSHIDDLSDDDIAAMIAAGFEATTDPSRLDEVKTIVICVPTPLSEDGGPDLGPINSAVKTIAEHLQPGQTIILESTTYP